MVSFHCHRQADGTRGSPTPERHLLYEESLQGEGGKVGIKGVTSGKQVREWVCGGERREQVVCKV